MPNEKKEQNKKAKKTKYEHIADKDYGEFMKEHYEDNMLSLKPHKHDAIRDQVNENMPPILTLREKDGKDEWVEVGETKAGFVEYDREMNRAYFEMLSESLSSSHFWQFNGLKLSRDSDEMKKVKKSLDELNKLLASNVYLEDGDNEKILEAMAEKYDNAIDCATKYVLCKTPKSDEGKQRKEYVTKLLDIMGYEKAQLEGAVKFAREMTFKDVPEYTEDPSQKDENGNPKKVKVARRAFLRYGDILRYCRSITVSRDENGDFVDRITSEVIAEKNGNKKNLKIVNVTDKDKLKNEALPVIGEKFDEPVIGEKFDEPVIGKKIHEEEAAPKKQVKNKKSNLKTSRKNRLGGGATSSVYNIPGDSKKRIFKKGEKQGVYSVKGIFDVVLSAMDGVLMDCPKEDKPGAMILKDFLNELAGILTSLANENVYESDVEKKEANNKTLIAYGDILPDLGDDAKTIDRSLDRLVNYTASPELSGEKLEKYKKRIRQMNETFLSGDKKTEVLMKAISKNYLKAPLLLFGCAAKFEIHDGADISARNVATNRMNDRIFKFNPGNFAHSENANIKVDNKPTDGILMERAKGIPLDELLKEYSKYTEKTITPKAMKQLVQIELTDMICAQGDRHEHNIFVQCDEKMLKKNKLVILGFTGIDNDMSFGNVSVEKIKKYNPNDEYDYVPTMFNKRGDINFSIIDQETYKNILAVNLEQIDFEMADLGLSPDELKALKERFEYVRATLKEKVEGKKISLVSEYSQPINRVFELNTRGGLYLANKLETVCYA